ncbi:16S rRNA (guanine(527)-N(7))-methyltransferase RsmG [Gloeothece verrucosa]|uniref:Ribosomal RNA small subunit methyltransferase G n=1 Tax=Gloeothece verrucosa (strain PCC 7822) TaxID=497965 RepID=E0U6L3_GLOV7|nr:16S rRNA (guanine(527)-N(7))-methyltransferase RsmG [Gloeothece verrucosa]ADN14772.1 methyltransferase GidB [Gloeothece verrucosa PCC 7822]
MTELQQLPLFKQIWQESLHWQPNEQQQAKFQRLYTEILLANRQLNLTRIIEPEEFWEKHLWDSLSGVVHLGLKTDNLSVIDIGTGAGFPGVPVAIAFPGWTVTLLDSVQKKMVFLNSLVSAMELENTSLLTERVEMIAQDKKYRESYDISLIRAVASASICAEYALPLLKLGGLAILYRGHWSAEENLSLKTVVEQLGGKIEEVKQLTTPITKSIRNCVYIRKISATPKQYPRAVGIPRQKPL